MGYVNTLWEMPPLGASDYVEGDLHGRGAYGIMQLVHNPWEDTLGRAAMLTGLSEEELETIRAANVRGGAAVLTDLQGTNKPAGLNGWYDTVAGYGGGFLYANEVFETLRKRGLSHHLDRGEPTTVPAERGSAADLHRPSPPPTTRGPSGDRPTPETTPVPAASFRTT